MSKQKITVRQIARDYRATKLGMELRTEPGTVILYRPVSFVLAWVLMGTGIHPTTVTIAASLLIPAIVWAALEFEPSVAILAICGLGLLYAVLDCVDGTMARCLSLTSKLGTYLDFLFDILQRFVFYAALGYLADQLIGPPPGSVTLGVTWLYVTIAAAWCALFARLCRTSLKEYGNVPDGTGADSGSSRKEPDGNMVKTIAWAVFAGLDQLYALLGLLAWLSGVLDYYILWIALVSVADAIIAQFEAIGHLRKLDQLRKGP